MYEIPVRIYNISTSSKRITITKPQNKVFKLNYNKAKNSVIAPGLFLEILITFDTDILDRFEDKIVITSENNLKLPLYLKAYKPEAIVQYEPLVNLGFVPVNSKKKEIIEFVNDGMIDAKIELKMDRNPDISLSEDRFELGKCSSKNKRKTITITYEYIYI